MTVADGLQERYEFGLALIEEAGALAMGYFERLDSLTVTDKGPQDVVSEADVETEKLIRGRIEERFPTDAFLGEESGRSEVTGAEGIWVVDPIDGTMPFVNGLASWCVSIAYVHDGITELGFVAVPAAGELFVGRRGAGATLNGRAISVSRATGLDQGITYVGYSSRIGPDDILPVFDRLLHQGGMYVRDGSGTLGLCNVACGRLIGYVEPHINSWDALAALAIIEAAGGRINDFLADDGLTTGNPVIAGPPVLYPALAALLGK